MGHRLTKSNDTRPGTQTATLPQSRSDPEVSWDEREIAGEASEPIATLRLLARLLVQAATAAQTAPSSGPENPVDVAAPPEVRLRRE
jgi:hypothetical protein